MFKNTDALTYLKGLKAGSVDLILTDPPYAISKKTGFKSVGKKSVSRFAVSMDFGKWDNIKEADLTLLLDSVFAEAFRVLHKGGTLIMFYDLWKISDLWRLAEKHKFKQARFIEWLKTNPVPLNSKRNYLTNAREVAICVVKGGNGVFNSEYDNGVYSQPIHRDGGKRLHPTQKPLALMKALIEKHSKPEALVIDPFAGSATTLVAAKAAGRKYGGCELNPSYFKKAEKRLEE